MSEPRLPVPARELPAAPSAPVPPGGFARVGDHARRSRRRREQRGPGHHEVRGARRRLRGSGRTRTATWPTPGWRPAR